MSTSENVEKVVSECNEKRQSISEFWNKTRGKNPRAISAWILNILYSSTSQEVSTSENVEKVVSECNEKRQSISEFWNKTRGKNSAAVFLPLNLNLLYSSKTKKASTCLKQTHCNQRENKVRFIYVRLKKCENNF